MLGGAAVDVYLNAGRDALVGAVGKVDGSINATRDASVATYADLAGGVQAGQDIPYVWVVGNLTASLTAAHDIGYYGYEPLLGENFYYAGPVDFLVYGNVDSLISAGGVVGSLRAKGSIAGSIDAGEKIEQIRSGASITAALTAPVITAPVENDATLAALIPPPPPPNPAQDLLNQLAAEHALLLADRDTARANVDTAIADFLTSRQQTADDLAQARSDAEAAVAATKKDAATALAQDIAAAESQFYYEQTSARDTLDELKKSVNAAFAAATSAVDYAREGRDAAYATALEYGAESAAYLDALAVDQLRGQTSQILAAERARLAREAALKEEASWFSEDMQSYLLFAGGFVPVVGEVIDVYIIFAPDSKLSDRLLAGGSLLVNIFVGGALPNFGSSARGMRVLNRLDEAADVTRGAGNLAEGLADTARTGNKVRVHATPKSVAASGGSVVGLGKSAYIQELGDVSIARGRGWTKDRLTSWDSDSIEEFGSAFREATRNAKQIEFNLNGVDVGRAWLEAGELTPILAKNQGLVTEWELRQIIANRDLLSKTTFRLNGKVVHGSNYDEFYDFLLQITK